MLPVCGQIEVNAHVHEEICFAVDADQILVCGLEGHIHTEACVENAATETTASTETTESTEETIFVEEAGFGFFALRPTVVVDGGTFTSQEGNELTWELTHNPLNDEYTLTIDGEGAMPDYKNAGLAPWYAYPNYSMRLVFGDGITRVGNRSFENFIITDIDWGGVSTVGAYAFYRLGAYAGYGAAVSKGVITHIKLSDNIRVVEQSAFGNPYEYSYTLELNEGLETIGIQAFVLGSSDVHIPSTVQFMKGSSFVGGCKFTVASENPWFCAVDGILYSKDMTVLLNVPLYMQIEEFTVPNTVTEISYGAMSSHRYLQKVTIPSSVKVYPTDLFRNCGVLSEVWFEDGTAPYNFVGMFFGTNNISRVRLPENTTFSIGSSIFTGYADNYPNLESFEFPNGVKSINTLWGYNTGLKALQNVIYDAEKAQILTSWIFGPSAHFDLTFGLHVNYLYKDFSSGIIPHVLSFRFEGPNRFFVEPGGFDNAPAPFTGLSGLFYVDEQGLVYHCDEETDEAALIYCQPGITDAVIPATIDPNVETYPEEPGVGTEFTVTTVRRNALKDAEDLETMVFEDPSKITTLEILSLANCQSLSKVNNQTTVQSALALFSHAQVGYNMFHNTGLGGASGSEAFDQEMDGDDRLELEADDASKLEITASGDLTWVENRRVWVVIRPSRDRASPLLPRWATPKRSRPNATGCISKPRGRMRSFLSFPVSPRASIIGPSSITEPKIHILFTLNLAHLLRATPPAFR